MNNYMKNAVKVLILSIFLTTNCISLDNEKFLYFKNKESEQIKNSSNSIIWKENDDNKIKVSEKNHGLIYGADTINNSVSNRELLNKRREAFLMGEKNTENDMEKFEIKIPIYVK